MALHGGGHLELKKAQGEFLGTLWHSSGEMDRYHTRKNQLSAILFQVPVFFFSNALAPVPSSESTTKDHLPLVNYQ